LIDLKVCLPLLSHEPGRYQVCLTPTVKAIQQACTCEIQIAHESKLDCLLLQDSWDYHWLVLIWLLPGLPPLTDLEEPQQTISRRLVPGYVCLCHHSQRLLWLGDLGTCILMGCGALQRPLDLGQPWHCLPRPCHLHTGASLSHFSFDFGITVRSFCS